MKYTFEIMKEYEDAFRGISVYSVSDDKKLMVDFIALEELEDAQKEIDEAYQRGLEDGKEYGLDESDMREAVSYQKGLDDAWDAARKIVLDEGIDMNTLCTIFRRGCSDSVIRDYSAAEAIEKLKAYEEKQKAADEIEVGDEVNWGGDCFIVTRIFQPRNMKEQCDGIDNDGCVYHDVLMDDLEKTGRHSDIMKILEEMQT